MNESNAPETIVGPSVKIQGDLNSEGNVRIEGQVTGKINTPLEVFVGENAKIIADLHSGTCVVAGEVQGNLKVDSNLVLLSSAKVFGDITCMTMRVEDGAVFNGKCAMQAGTPKVSSKHKENGGNKPQQNNLDLEPELS